MKLTLCLFEKEYVIIARNGNVMDIKNQLPSSWSVKTIWNISGVFMNYFHRKLFDLTIPELDKLHIGRLLKLPHPNYEWWEYGYPIRFS